MSTLHVLFVCTGNICRSPIAERLAARLGERSQIPDFTVASAGTRAVISHPIHTEAARVLQRLGGDSSDFSARQLTFKIAASADLVLAMTRGHRDAVLELAPKQLRRTFTLTEAARLVTNFDARSVEDLTAARSRLGSDQAPDIEDPIGQGANVFSAVGAQIADLLPPIIDLCLRHVSRSTTG